MNFSLNESLSDDQTETQANETLGNIVIINCVLNAPLMLISILGNFLVFTAIWRTVSLRSRPSMMFISSLAVTDLLVGLIVQPIYIANLLTSVRLLKLLSSMMAFAACGVSLGTMATISFDRFLALHYHMRYAAIMTSSRAISALVTTWVIISLLSCLVFWDPITCMFIMAILISFYLIISAYFYVRLYRIVRRHQIQIQHQDCNPQALNPQALNQKRLNKSAFNTFVFYTSTILCYLPRFISVPFSDPNTHDETAWIFADTLVFMNSAINPVLYCWRLGDLRAAVAKVLRNMFCKQTVEN
ncbi:cannabinoid receptor 2-like [Oculina patagonica]